MALEDFLGSTSEIKIIDFLAENNDNYYNQTEISEFTELSRTTVNTKIPGMIYNNILEIKEEIGKMKTYQLADNKIINKLVSAALEHSFKLAESTLDDGEVTKNIREMICLPPLEEQNRYYHEAASDIILIPTETGQATIMKPAGRIKAKILASA